MLNLLNKADIVDFVIRKNTQVPLRFSKSRRGGVRPGAGRPKKPGAGVPRRRRPAHVARNPLHVTMRLLRGLSSVRRPGIYRGIERALFAAASALGGFRLVEFSVQRDHLHLIVEARDKKALTAGMRGLAIRVAKAH